MEERIEVLNKFTNKLANSGYTRAEARRIITSGLKGYEGRRRRSIANITPLHRGAGIGQVARNRKKLMNKFS